MKRATRKAASEIRRRSPLAGDEPWRGRPIAPAVRRALPALLVGLVAAACSGDGGGTPAQAERPYAAALAAARAEADKRLALELPAGTSSAQFQWRQVSAGRTHSCGVAVDGQGYCWGQAQFGELGTGAGAQVSAHRPLAVAGGHAWTAVSAGLYLSCGIADGRGYCWGGEPGLAAEAAPMQPAPLPVAFAWKLVSAGGSLACGLTPAGQAFCWRPNRPPVPVPGARTWQGISAGNAHACGVTADGDAYCWGNGLHGQLGNGRKTISNTPVKVAGEQAWTRIAAGYSSTCGVTGKGDGYCWGAATRAALDVGAGGQQTVPFRLPGEHKWRAVRPGAGFHACGVTAEGRGYCWGENHWGQLGDGTNLDRSKPAPIAGDLVWAAVSPGLDHTCGLTTDGAAYCWGRSGYLGANLMSGSMLPARVADP